MILAKHVLKFPLFLSKLHKFLFLDFYRLNKQKKNCNIYTNQSEAYFVKLDYTLENEILIFWLTC